MEKEIRIPIEYIERIDKFIDDEGSQHSSREGFIISAIEKMLNDVNSANG